MTTVLDAFTCFDCWALALALRERYPHLRLAALTGPGASWVHALAYEPTTDLYIDVTGPHTAEDVQTAWDDEPDWDELREIPAYELHGLTRLAPEISTDDGITAALAAGWTPQPPPAQDSAAGQAEPIRAHVYDYAVRVTEIATETLRLSPKAAAAAFADPQHPTPAEIEAARAAAAQAGADLDRRWHDVETERVSPDLIEVTTD